jgi:hypothetical protein
LDKKSNLFYNEVIQCNPKLFFLSETWHSTPFTHHAINANYTIFDNFGERNSSFGRLMKGHVLGIHKDIVNLVSEIHQNSLSICMEIKQNDVKILFCFAYLPPSPDINFEDIFSQLETSNAPCIIIGDLNSRIGTYQRSSDPMGSNMVYDDSRVSQDKTINPRGRKLIQYLDAQNLKILNGSTTSDKQGSFTFTNRNGSSVIDLAITSPLLFPYVDLRILESEESHHSPLHMTLYPSSTQQQHKMTMKMIWNPAKAEEFRNKFENLLQHHNHETVELSRYKTLMKDAAKSCGMLKHISVRGTFSPRWFDSKCADMKRETRSWLRKLRKSTDNQQSIIRNKYLDMKRCYLSYRDAKKKLYFHNLTASLANCKNTQSFYKGLSHYNPKYRQPNTTEKVTPDQFGRFFGELYSDREASNYEDGPIEGGDDELDSEFNFDELNDAIKYLAKNKAPGPDFITNELWKALSVTQRLNLLDSINQMWRDQRIPADMSHVTMKPVFKKGSVSDPSNFRPISLVNTCLKLLTSLMTARLTFWCDKHSKISEYQAAYKKGYGCEDHVFLLNSIIQNGLQSKKGRVYALFVDLSKAFDLVSHSKLWTKLSNVGLSPKFIGMIKSVYKNASANVVTNEGTSYSFPLKKGVLQGENLSPKLFTIFINDLVNVMYTSGIPALKIASLDIHLLLYADDIVLVASNSIYLQEKIDVLRNYLHENDMKVNLNKTKAVVFRNGRHKVSSPLLLWGDEKIEVANQYNYLGVSFNQSLDYTKTCAEFISKARRAENHLFSIFYKSSIQTFNSRESLFNSLVKSVLMYCSFIWGPSNVDQLVKFQLNFLRRLFWLPKKTPNWFLRLETCTTSIEISFIKNLLYFLLKLTNRNEGSALKTCFYALKQQNNNRASVKNWYKQVSCVLKKYGCNEIVDCIERGEDIDKCLISKCISLVTVMIQSNDIQRMNSSTSMPLYRYLRTHVTRDDFLNYTIRWTMVRLFVQLRSNLSQFSSGNKKVIRLNELQHFYDPSVSPECNCCSLETTENLFHVLFVCPNYTYGRNELLSMFDLPTSQNHYYEFFADVTMDKIKSIYNFIRKAAEERDELLRITSS